MKNRENFFLKTDDSENIFYSTNFKPGEQKSPVLVLNYGLVCSNFHWEKQIEYFEEQGYSILLHDYRGHFQSSGIERIESITFSRIAKDLSLVIKRLELSECIVIGHSMGVNVSLEFAHNYPEYVKKMALISGTIFPIHNILMDTHLTGPLSPILKNLLETFPKPFKGFWKYGGWAKPVKTFIRSGGFNPKQVGYDFIEGYLSKVGELGPELFFQLVDQMQKHDCLAFTQNIETPTLVVGGNRDKVIPNFSQRLINQTLKNAELYVIHSGSHVPQVDFPDLVNERLDYFINHEIRDTQVAL